MDNRIYFIYITTNLINGKKYIGKHFGYVDDDYLGSGKLLKKAIKKYGKEAFKREIIDFSQTEEENCEKEQYYISLFDACHNDLFYNIHEGGAGGNTTEGLSLEEKLELSKKHSERTSGKNNPMYGIHRSDEWKTKHSYWAKNIRDNSSYRTEEFKKHMSEVTSGEKNGMYGKHHSLETRKKMSENRKGKTTGSKNGMYGKSGANAINGKRIIMLNDNQEVVKYFACKREALNYLNVKCYKGLNKALTYHEKYKGYYWVYDQDKSVETIS